MTKKASIILGVAALAVTAGASYYLITGQCPIREGLWGVIRGVPEGEVSLPPETKRALPSIEGVSDGRPLYSFLLKEAPDIVSQIPCQCCGRMLSWCYQGGCPPT